MHDEKRLVPRKEALPRHDSGPASARPIRQPTHRQCETLHDSPCLQKRMAETVQHGLRPTRHSFRHQARTHLTSCLAEEDMHTDTTQWNGL